MLDRLFKSGRFQAAIWASIGIIFKTNPLFGQDEDYTGFRHELYQEDNDRMSVTTDSVGWDIGLNDHVRINGQLVRDAISGATPTGAPPQSQWPFATFNDFFNQDYSKLFQAAINNTNNLELYQSGLFSGYPNPYQAYTNYVAQNNPQLGPEATNNAAQSYNKLITSPSYHNTTVPLTQISDLRMAVSLGVPVTFALGDTVQKITPQASYSTESDYDSLGLALNYQTQLNQKNTTLDLSLSQDIDSVRDDTLVHWQSKNGTELLAGINQLLTPKSYIEADFTFGDEHGYLSDPYRGVMALLNFLQYNAEDAALIPENRPRNRTKEIFYTRYTQFIDPLDGSIELSYRFFHDSYGIYGNTFEGVWRQNLGRHFVLSPGFRYYRQTQASFYYVMVPDYDNLPPYYSSDYRLSRFQSFNISVDLTCKVAKQFYLDLAYSRYIVQGLDGVTSQSAYPSANVFSIEGRIFF
ncbi:MAG TPA: DUF3570 domain-containing protein [Candidatus Acidoferrales bacterium]|jgi:hypothetical protein|nr:DUF3570 domain-containing protein [Candidatus Acidoferrales bacterium]